MNTSHKHLFGMTPRRWGTVSLIGGTVGMFGWRLSIGFFMVYVAGLGMLVGAVSGLLAVGSGIYHRDWLALAAGLGSIALAWVGLVTLFWAMTHF